MKARKEPFFMLYSTINESHSEEYPTEGIYLCETIQMHTLHIDWPPSGE